MLARRAAHLRSAAALQLGDPDAARSLAAAALADDPFDEGAARDLMAAHLAAGQHAAALQVYDRLRRSLADEFGADPSAATAQLHLAVLSGDASTAPVAAPVAAVEPARSPVSRAGRGDHGSPAPPGTTTGPPLPLVGRTGEVQRVHAVWDAAAGGRGELLLLTGAAGVGKTRLATRPGVLAHGSGSRRRSVRGADADRPGR